MTDTPKPIRIDVPATSANLGPGFDTLGLALELSDEVTATFLPDSDEVVLTDAGDLKLNPTDNLLCRAYRSWTAEDGSTLPGVRFTLTSRIPAARGLGSSAASIVAGLAAAAHVSGQREARHRILTLASRLEGHPDNVVAATLGGLTAAFCQDDEVHALNVANHLSIGVALYLPQESLSTRKAREALPREVPLADAVFDLGRLAYLTTALLWGRWDRIGPAMCDRLHQPYRGKFIPALDPVISAAVEAGAYGAALSGGGPSVIALGPRDCAQRFAEAMSDEAQRHDWPGESVVTSVREHGVTVMEL